MKFTLRSNYAILALFDLAAARDGAALVQSRDIALRQNIPQRFLEQILLSLKRAGLILSVRGARGGYRLALPPRQITLRDAIQAVEGTIHLRGNALTESAPQGHQLLQSIWCEVEQSFLQTLAAITLEDLKNRQQPRVLMYHI